MPVTQAAVDFLIELAKEATALIEEGEVDLGKCRRWHRRVMSALIHICGEGVDHVQDFDESAEAFDKVHPRARTAALDYNVALSESVEFLHHSISLLIVELQNVAAETPTAGTKVFIGHGGKSPAWMVLQRFLEKKLKLETDEFDAVPAAGYHTSERLQEMLDNACFAFVVMTGEDEVGDKLRARQNVIHEIGLFQGRLGIKRAIVLLEEGCEQFSNISGLIYIPFPKGNIEAATERVRGVLEREGIIE